jgi:transcriptional regulator with XRE-family HTH domain
MKEINRLKIVLVEQKHIGKWLAEAIGKNEAIVSRWYSNVAQSSIETFMQIAEALNVDIRELLISTKK